MARSKVGKALAARMRGSMGFTPGSAAHAYWMGSAGQSVQDKATKDKSTKSKKMPIIERGKKRHKMITHAKKYVYPRTHPSK